MKGLIFSIKKYAIHDGPGIRVTFFMKGCSLNCWWCHNPEGIDPTPVSVEQTERVGDAEFRRMVQVGKLYTVDDILGIAEGERVFFDHSGGGVTFSGGEPMEQFPFLMASLKLLRERGYHTAVDTTGIADRKYYSEIIPYTSLFLYDLKHMDAIRHMQYTGKSNIPILDNYRFLIRSGVDIMLRIPIIPGYNDDADNLKALRDFVSENNSPNLLEIDLLPFHRIGSSKYRRFGLPYRMQGVEVPSKNRMAELVTFFSAVGVKVKAGG